VSRVLVTGAGGFIGQHAVPALRERDFEVIAARGDLLAAGLPDEIVADARPTHLLHLAWHTEHGEYWESEANDRHLEASVVLLEAFARAGGLRAVTVGTCAEYDWSAGGRLAEDAPCRPATRYGQAKLALARAGAEMALPVAHARLFFPYGPGEDPRRLVPSVARAVLAGREAPISGGTQVRDFVHASDVGAALAGLVAGEVAGPVNVGSGEGTAVREVARLVAAAAGREELLDVGALTDRPGEPDKLVADVSRLAAETGWRPEVTLEEGIRRTVAWWREVG
jgi:nucleoside-diphosphate-sugar epimerase